MNALRAQSLADKSPANVRLARRIAKALQEGGISRDERVATLRLHYGRAYPLKHEAPAGYTATGRPSLTALACFLSYQRPRRQETTQWPCIGSHT